MVPVHTNSLNYLHGRVVKTSTFGAILSGLIPNRVIPITLKLVFTASLLGAQHQKGQCAEQSDKFTCCVAGKNT